jgi:hypothetical protein
VAPRDERPKHGHRKRPHQKQCKYSINGMRTARRGKIIRS